MQGGKSLNYIINNRRPQGVGTAERTPTTRMKKIVIPSVLCAAILIAILSSVLGGGNKVNLSVEQGDLTYPFAVPDTIELNIYVENSGSMDGYMCAGSELKDAVFDYVSEAKKTAAICRLNYINSQVVAYNGTLDAYIKDLNPSSFAQAGGSRANTDLRQILSTILSAQKKNTISIFVSDCILDIPQNALDFFGNCQVSVKNTFNDALTRIPTLGVQIAQMESKFDGTWFCGHNSERLSGVKRPYYIWVIGDVRLLARLNREAPLQNVIHGMKNYCAYAPVKNLPCDVEQKSYVANRTISVELLTDISTTLQNSGVACNTAQFSVKHPEQVQVTSVVPVTAKDSRYSHVVTLEIANPQTLKEENVTFNYPYLASWVEQSNDDTGKDAKKHLGQTTGIKYLITGVAEAYKDFTSCGNFTLNLKNR